LYHVASVDLPKKYKMSLLNKIFSPFFLRCACSVAIGVGMVAVILTGLAIYANATEDTKMVAAPVVTDTPQDKQLLEALANDLRAGTDIGGEATALDQIAPAAGSPLNSLKPKAE